MHRVQVANVKAFHHAFETNCHLPGPLYALFYGRDDPATGQSWCPDCVTAKPHIEHALETVATGTLIECPVDRKTTPTENYFEGHGTVVKAIPTVVKWEANGDRISHLVEADCWNNIKLTAFFRTNP